MTTPQNTPRTTTLIPYRAGHVGPGPSFADSVKMKPILVLAPTGKTGRRVGERLRKAGIEVRSRSRRSTPAFSWQDPATWDAALDGVGGVYLAYSPDLLVPGAVEHVAAFTARAKAAGVDRLVLLSGRGEDAAVETERRAREHMPHLTCLRAGWFWQNFTEGDFAPMVEAGVLALPVGQTPEPFVDCDDIADVAVAALLQDPAGGAQGVDGGEPGAQHAGQTYEVTGPVAMTFAQATAVLSHQRGHEVRFVSQTLSQADAAWEAAEVPEQTRWLLRELFGTVFDGRNSGVGDGVQRALGRPARDVSASASQDLAPGSDASGGRHPVASASSALPGAGGQR